MASVESSPEIAEFSSPGDDVNVGSDGADTDGRADGPSASWADEVESEMPDTLLHLIKNGVRFKFAKPWSDTARPHLVKSLSVYFSVDAVVSSENILQAFDEAGVDIDEITGIQRRTSNRSWVVSFESQEAKELALEKASIQIAGYTVFLGDCENRLVLVKVYEAPSELPDTAVIGCLSYYGRVLSFRRDKVFQVIENGVRTARMRVDRPIPSILNLAGELVRIWYPNQPKTCRNCGSPDHLVKECQSVRCFNCERPGHRAEQCEEPRRCSICRSDEHRLPECPFLRYSADVDSSEDKRTEVEKEKAKEEDRAKYKEKLENARRKQHEVEKQQRQMQIAVNGKDKDQGQAPKQDKGGDQDKGKDKERHKDNDHTGKDNKDKSDVSRKEPSSRDDDKSEKRARRSRSNSREKHRDRRESEDERERRERRDYEAWKDSKRRDREYSRRDYYRDRSNKRDYYSDEDYDDGWTEVSHRRRRHYDR